MATRNCQSTPQGAIAHRVASPKIDANDLIDLLLAIADELDPLINLQVGPGYACPGCGEREADQLQCQVRDDLRFRLAVCRWPRRPASRGVFRAGPSG